MAAQTFNVKIEGYWRDEKKGGLPSVSGVYFVYEGKYNEQEKSCSLYKLIYIGESDNINQRINNHEKYPEWKKHVRAGNTLYFSAGPVNSNDRFRVEAAYIFKHKPPVNTEYVNNFPFDQTRIISTGETKLLNTDFTVYRS
jgi:hypothetical protein